MPEAAGQEWRDGWKMLFAAGMGVGLSAAPAYSLGVFIEPLEHEFGWSRAEISAAMAIMSTIVTLGSPFIGLALDRLGARRLSLGGTVLLCTGFCALALLKGSLVVYWAVWAALATGVLFASPLVWLMAVSNRFTAKRGLALSLVLCGSNLTGAVAPVLAASLIDWSDWRTAYVGLGFFLFVTCFPLAFFFFYDARDLRRREGMDGRRQAAATARLGEGMTFQEGLRSRNFWLLGLTFFLAGGAITAFIIHFVPMLTDRGLSPILAASAVSTLSIAAIVGRLIAGYLMDRIFAPWIAAVALLMPVPACIILLAVAPGYGVALLAGALVGLSIGSEFNMVAFLTARYFGMRSYGVIHGMMYGAFTGGAIFAPTLVGLVYAAKGDYRLALMLLAGTFAVAAAGMLFCTRYPNWRIDGSEAIELSEASGGGYHETNLRDVADGAAAFGN